MTQRAAPAQFQPVMDARPLSEGARRSQMLTAVEDEGLPTWGDACPPLEQNVPARTIEGAIAEAGDDDDPAPTVIVEGEHWIERVIAGERSHARDDDDHDDDEDDAAGETMVGTYDVASTVEVHAVPSASPPRRISETRARKLHAAASEGARKRPSKAPPRRVSIAPPEPHASPDDSSEADAWSHLEARYRADGHFTDLVELYLQRLEGVKTRGQRAIILRKIGDVMRDGLHDGAQALDAFVEALLLEPGDAATVQAIEALARPARAFRGVIDAVAAQLDAIDLEDKGKERQIALCEHLVRWTRGELGKREAAQRFVDRIHAIDPTHPAIHRRLASVYREHGQWDSQRDALSRALLAARQDDERRLLHVSLGELSEHRFGDAPAAVKHYEQALRIDPRALDALNGLERIYRTQERFVELLDVLERQVQALPATDDARVNALLRVAEVHELHFVRPQLAAPKLEAALAIDPRNVTALLALERCYHAMRAWNELIRTIEVRLEVEPKKSDKVTLALQIAEIWDSKLGDPQGTMRAYRRAFELDDRNVTALTELSRLSERSEDWTAAAAYRARLADLSPSKEQQSRMHVTIGEMLAPAHRDPTRARMHFERAAQLHPANVGAWEALEKDARTVGDVDRATVYLEKRIAHTEASRVKAQLLVELGRLHDGLGETTSAAGAYARAIEADPSNEAAANAMFVHHSQAERWAEAQPLCDLLVNCAARDGDTERSFELLRAATRIATHLGNDERALVAAMAAYRASPRVAAREDLVSVCHRVRGDGAMVSRAAETLEEIARRASELPPETVSRLADIRRAAGDEAGAIELYGRALAMDKEDTTALTGMYEIFLARQDWERACAYKLKLAHAAVDENDQFVALVDTGELWAHQAKNLAMAALAYEEALGIRPRDHWLLHTLMWLYGELECWEKLAEVLRAVAELETDGAKKAKGIYAMAQVMRDKLSDLPRAAALFEEVLELDPKRLDAFERVVRIHTELRDWSELKGAYGRMLRRLRSDESVELKHALFFQLGLIFRDRIGDAPRALDAFRAADRIKPGDDEVRRIICELLVLVDKVGDAVLLVRAAIAKRPTEAALYLELYTLFCRQRAFDKAWCALDAVVTLGGSLAPEHARFVADYPPVALSAVPGTLTGVAWRSHVLHGELEAALTAIFAVLTPAVMRARLAMAPKGWIEKTLGERLVAEGSVARTVSKAVRDGADVLGLEAPVLHARKGPSLAATPAKPAMYVSLEACEPLADDALAFVVGKHLAEERPELAARAAFPSVTELTALLQTGLYLAQKEPAGPPPAGAGETFAKVLRSAMTEAERKVLRNAVRAARAEGTPLDVARWMQLADVSASRAGLLLGGSLDAARRAIAHEAQAPGDAAPREKMNALLVFSVSDEYADLRQAIGVGVRE